jgi:DnaJ-class molecular chaperone
MSMKKEVDKKKEPCRQCRGTGKVPAPALTTVPFGVPMLLGSQQVPCPDCEGTGYKKE